MNDPIVSPWLIYLTMQIDGILDFVLFLCIVSGVILVGTTIIRVAITIDPSGLQNPEKSRKNTNRLLRYFIPIWLFFCSIYMLTPSSKTIVTLLVANQITPNRILQAGEKAEHLWNKGRDDILMLLREAKDLEAEGDN